MFSLEQFLYQISLFVSDEPIPWRHDPLWLLLSFLTIWIYQCLGYLLIYCVWILTMLFFCVLFSRCASKLSRWSRRRKRRNSTSMRRRARTTGTFLHRSQNICSQENEEWARQEVDKVFVVAVRLVLCKIGKSVDLPDWLCPSEMMLFQCTGRNS